MVFVDVFKARVTIVTYLGIVIYPPYFEGFVAHLFIESFL